MKIYRLSKQSLSVAVAMQLFLTLPAVAGPEANSSSEKASSSKSIWMKDLFDLKSISLQWEGANPIRVIRIPLISERNIAASYLLGKIPFVGTGSSKSSFLQLRKAISVAEAKRMSASNWSSDSEIESHLNKNPFMNENALHVLEPGEEVRFEMDAAKAIGLKLGGGLGVVPVGGSASVSKGQKFVFIIRKLNENQVQLDVTRMNESTKGTRANVGSGFTFLADSEAAVAKGLNFRDFYSSLYMNLIQNTQNKGVTDSYILDLNSTQETRLFKDSIIKKVTKKQGSTVKSSDDLRELEQSFMDELQADAQKLDSDVRIGRSEIESEITSLNRNAGMVSVFGKFLYSFNFSRNFIRVEKPDNENISVLQFYQAEAAQVGAKRSFWSDKNGRSSKMGIVFSTKGNYAEPEIDKLLEISLQSTRYTYASNNQSQIKQWREYFVDFLPESLFNQVFSGQWGAESKISLIDPVLTTSVYFNRDYFLEVSSKAIQNAEGPQFYFEKQLESYIQNANGRSLGQVAKWNTVWEDIYQFFVNRFGRENEGFIEIDKKNIGKQVKEISEVLAQVVAPDVKPEARIEAFESLRKNVLFKRISTGFLLSLVDRHDLNRFVTIQMSRSYDELVEVDGNSLREHHYQEYKAGAERDPDVKAIQEMVNRAKGISTSIPADKPTSGEQPTYSKCESVFAA